MLRRICYDTAGALAFWGVIVFAIALGEMIG